MAFEKIFENSLTTIGFESDRGFTWLTARMVGDGVYVDKAYMESEPSLSIKQARLFAGKILGFCDILEGKK